MTEESLRKLLQEMSLQEKIGQLVQLPGSYYEEQAVATGSLNEEKETDTLKFLAGSTLGLAGAEALRTIQKTYMERQPHHIPLLFMLDVIHGYRTVFPCPLGQGASFSPELSEECARIAAREAAVGGLHVTFAPMADLVRDARWGRVMESTGEDPYLNGCMAAAMVRGFQGENAGEKDRVAACVKHFAGYGAPVAGLDYGNVELSEYTLRDAYLPGYQAAIDVGCELVMTAFHTWNGIPSSGNPFLMRQLLRKEMGFEGVLISDWGAVGEMVPHGFCKDEAEAAVRALEAGVDIDMCSGVYGKCLERLVEEGKLEESLIEEAVWKVLRLKNRLGLFENPYKDGDAGREKSELLCAEHRQRARQAVRESIVLLKNKDEILPLKKDQKVAFIGPYIEDQDMDSSWAIMGRREDQITIRQAAQEVFPADQISFSKGCTLLNSPTLMNLEYYSEENWEEKNKTLMQEAEALAGAADVVVLCLGEHRKQSGEAASRGEITLPPVQLELLRRISKVNTRIVTVLFSGRPLDIKEAAASSKALLAAWMPGTEGGHGILDVLTGAYNPSGKLPMSFPYCVGQLPVSYQRYSTGRPRPELGYGDYTTRYLDIPMEPLYPFGYGLSYTTFEISPVFLDSDKMVMDKNGAANVIRASVHVKNTGSRTGTEVVQLYIGDVKASRVRPTRQLKSFSKVTLEPLEEKTVSFEIREEMLRFYTMDNVVKSEPGLFKVWIGNSSMAQAEAEFILTGGEEIDEDQ